MTLNSRATRVALVVSLLLPSWSATGSAAGQDVLDRIRQLYAAAEYEDALTALDRLKGSPGTTEAIDIDRYRVLCLIALGMPDKADAAIGAILTIDPLYRPDPSEASPAVRAAFTAARRRMLPALVRGLYAEARDAFDRRAFRDAVTKFEKAQRAIEDPDARGIAALADMS